MRWLLCRTEARNLRPVPHQVDRRREAGLRVGEILVGEDRLILVGRRFSRCPGLAVLIQGSQGIQVAETQAEAGRREEEIPVEEDLRVEEIRAIVRSLLGQILRDRIRHGLAQVVRRSGAVRR